MQDRGLNPNPNPRQGDLGPDGAIWGPKVRHSEVTVSLVLFNIKIVVLTMFEMRGWKYTCTNRQEVPLATLCGLEP